MTYTVRQTETIVREITVGGIESKCDSPGSLTADAFALHLAEKAFAEGRGKTTKAKHTVVLAEEVAQ